MEPTVAIEVDEVLAETAKAFLLRFAVGSEIWEKWVPKSCIDDAAGYEIGDQATEVNVAEWFARAEGII